VVPEERPAIGIALRHFRVGGRLASVGSACAVGGTVVGAVFLFSYEDGEGLDSINTRVVGALGSLYCLRDPGWGAMDGAGAFALCV